MPTFLVTADVHMRPNTKALDEMFWQDLKTLYDKHKCEHLFIIGDLLDSPRPSIEYMMYLKGILQSFMSEDRQLTWLMGNPGHESCSHTQHLTSPLFFFKDEGAVTEPKVHIVGRNIFFLLPWAPSKLLKAYAKKFAAIAMENKYRGCKKFLMSHVGLKEGEVGEDYKVHQEISIKDMVPEAYDFVLLGDYHRHQFLDGTEGNSLYVGAPFPKSFKDTFSVGPWLLDTDGPEATVEALRLPSVYPGFHEWRIKDVHDLTLDQYDSRAVNRILCDVSLVERVRSLYPGARIEPQAFNPVMDRGRLEDVESTNAEEIFLAYCKSRNIKNKQFKTLGMEYLKKARGI